MLDLSLNRDRARTNHAIAMTANVLYEALKLICFPDVRVESMNIYGLKQFPKYSKICIRIVSGLRIQSLVRVPIIEPRCTMTHNVTRNC